MNKTLRLAHRASVLGAILLAPALMHAQTAAGSATPKAASPAGNEDDETVVLSPFVVASTQGSDSYQVDETLAGTRVRTNLKDLGSAISVVPSKMLQDLGATNAQSLLQYTTNTEVGGVYGNFGGMGNNSTISESARLLQPDNDTRVRGLAAADSTRNYFLTSIPWDGFNVDRVDMQRGPNSMLFGNGSPAGIINTGLVDAMLKNQVKVQDRFDQYGGNRTTLDINYVLLPHELGVRLIALNDEARFRQEETFNHAKRIYAAVRFDPDWGRSRGMQTEFRINNEYGDVKSRNPRTLPPLDQISPWFTSLNKLTTNPFVAHQTNGIAGGTNSTHMIPYINATRGREFWADPLFAFNSTSSQVADYVTESYAVGTPFGIGVSNNSDHSQPTRTTFPVTGSIPGGMPFAQPVGITTYSQYAVYANLPGSQYGVYRDKMITDPSIFDFYHKTLDGPNTLQWQRWDGFNLDFSQSFFNGRLGFDYSYYREFYIYGGQNYLNDQSYAIAVDVNTVQPDGVTPNPNVGRPYIETDSVYGNGQTRNDRESWRAQVFGDIKSSDFFQNKTINSILGDHHLTAVASQDTLKTKQMSWARWSAALPWLDMVSGSKSLNGGSRNVDVISYIGPNLSNVNSAAGLNLNGLSTQHLPTMNPTVSYFDSHWKYPLDPSNPAFVNPNAPWTLPQATAPYGTAAGDPSLAGNQSQNPANYVGWKTGSYRILSSDTGDIDQLYFAGTKNKSVVKSEAVSWQGYMFDHMVVPSFGWRRDKVTLAAAAAPYTDTTQGLIDPNNYDVGSNPASQRMDSRTWSVVVHAPKFITSHLPAGLDFSLFFDKSENFQAQSIRKDFVGNNIPDATGTTTEKGFTISVLDGRLSFKANWYDTKVKDASLTGNQLGSNSYQLYLLPTWAAAHAETLYAGLKNQTINGTSVQGNAWFWDYSNHDNGTPYGAQPRGPDEAASDAAELAMIKAFADNSLPQSFYDVYQMPISVANMKAGDWLHAVTQPNWNPVTQGAGALQSASGGTVGGISPSATVDTESKGVEFELWAKPLKNWNIHVNASKDTSTRQNLNKTLVALINQEKTLWDSAAGDIRLWSGGGQTMRAVFNQNIYGPYLNLLAQAGTQVPELSPWHANFVTNYDFDHGLVKGVNVGAAGRWQQGAILGYALNNTTQLIDVSKPLKGPSESSLDLWVGYTHKVYKNVTWNIQLNLRSVGRSPHLVPIAVEPDGTPAMFRIVDGQSWQLTNTFTF